MDHIEEVAKFITAHSKDIDSGNDVFTKYKKLIIYPNPVIGTVVNLNVEKGLASIYNMSGQKVYSDMFENGKVYIRTLKSGIYVINVTAGNDIYQGIMIVL